MYCYDCGGNHDYNSDPNDVCGAFLGDTVDPWKACQDEEWGDTDELEYQQSKRFSASRLYTTRNKRRWKNGRPIETAEELKAIVENT